MRWQNRLYRVLDRHITRAVCSCATPATLIICALAGPSAHAFDAVEGVIPKPDVHAELMLHAFPTIAPETRADHCGYFARPVPRVIHQIAANCAEKRTLETTTPWALYSQTMGYAFKVWSPEDLTQDGFATLDDIHKAVAALQREGRDDAVEQLLELVVLSAQGGIFVSTGTHPPTLNGKPVDLDDVINLQGLSVATSLHARDIGHMSIYLTHSFMAAPAHHPWLEAMPSLASKNALHLLTTGHAQLPARYLCGNAFLSRNLYGSFNVLLFTYLQSLGIFPEETPEGSPDALD